jgi:hypothetical protein
MTCEINISSISPEELPTILQLLSGLPAQLGKAVAGVDQPQTDDVGSSFQSTRERGLRKFLRIATQGQGYDLEVRRSVDNEPGTFVIRNGSRQWPVEVICSKQPRISLKKAWSGIDNLVLAYVWLETDEIVLMRYQEVEKYLEGAAFTPEGFYTKALSSSRKQDLLPYLNHWDIFFEG